jgi:hypothetical protein
VSLHLCRDRIPKLCRFCGATWSTTAPNATVCQARDCQVKLLRERHDRAKKRKAKP